MARPPWDASAPPIYGCLTGVEIPVDNLRILPGISLSRIFVDTFGANIMAFAPPPTPNSPHPGPWAAVQGGFTFESRVEVSINDLAACDGLSPTVAIWLVAAVLRLRVPAPIRLAVISNIPFEQIKERSGSAHAVAFESAPKQYGVFTAARSLVTEAEISWLRDTLPVAARLYHDERFFRAFSIFDQAQWSPTAETGAVLAWTSIEILFDLASEREKTKALCKALSEYVARDRPDRDRAYQTIQDLYFKRGQVVHAGRNMEPQDFVQSFRLVSTAFQRALIDGRLPSSPRETIH